MTYLNNLVNFPFLDDFPKIKGISEKEINRISIPDKKYIYYIQNDYDSILVSIAKLFLEKRALGQYREIEFSDYNTIYFHELAFLKNEPKEGCGLLVVNGVGEEFFDNPEKYYFSLLSLLKARDSKGCYTFLNFSYPSKEYFKDLVEILNLPENKIKVLLQGFLKFDR